MSTSQKDTTVSINIEPFLTPIAILIAAVMVSGSILIGLGRLNGGVLGAATTDTTAANSGTARDVWDEVKGVADSLGMDGNKILECAKAEPYKDEIAADTSEGSAAGVNGTPGFIIGKIDSTGKVNGISISGAMPVGDFESAIQKVKDNNTAGSAVASTDIDDDPILGNKETAKFAIVEFSDFECPFCARFHNQVFPVLKQKYIDSGEAIFVYRDFPLSFHEPMASQYANAANCINDQYGSTKFYDFSAKLFSAK